MAKVSMLSPFTEHTCTVSAITVSPGPMSDPFTVVTAQSGNASYYYLVSIKDYLCTASNPPVINTIIAINNSTVRVNWTRPTMPNGIITVYTIRYVTDNNGGSMDVPYNGEQVNTSTTEVELLASRRFGDLLK